MTRLPQRFIEDRALRDAARAVLEEDIARIRASLGEQGVASRVSSSVTGSISTRIKDGASDVLEQAKRQASDHAGVLAVLVGAILLWLMRGPLLALIDEEDEEDGHGDGEENATGGATGAGSQGAAQGEME
ncbi:MAG: hypothetical protein GC147_00060 [Porphyrobacter sp.]|nr:hypothetical protein [Porphyrobacter sp.]